jgi:hypothetical protein
MWLAAVTSSCVLYFNIPHESYWRLLCFAIWSRVRDEVGSLLQREFSSLRIHSKCFAAVLGKVSQNEGWNYPKSRSGSLTGQRAKFVAILFLALAANFKIVVNNCHLINIIRHIA